MRVAVLTISDTVSRGEREDLSGPAVVAVCRGLNWEVTSVLRVSDDPANIREQLRELSAHSRLPHAEPGCGTRNAALVHENAEAAQGE